MTQSPKSRIKDLEYEMLSEDLKRKISEIHLAIRSGDLSPEQLREAEEILSELKKKIESQGTRFQKIAGIPPNGGPVIGSGAH